MSIIEVKNLSKKYRIGHQKKGMAYGTLRDELSGAFRKPLQWLRGKKDSQEIFWALKNIDFNLKRGEILGVIGPNGAGKSTLLKILTRITPPTEGEAIIRGRVSSLLEVGTGFHPELTGRENIYLNGAILGMRKKEIDKKFNEIVEFAGIENFLDTPAKRYSSGMYVRLAFSVAAHLEPDILLVDEVLSVGDAAFQKKSLGKMEEVTQKKDQTIIFVSHNMGAIRRLCKKTMLLNEGQIVKIGPTQEVINTYLQSGRISPAERVWEDISQAPGDDVIRLHAVRVRDGSGQVAENIDIRKPFDIEIEYWNLQPGPQRVAGLHFQNEEGLYLFISYDLHNLDWRKKVLKTGVVKSICKIPGNFLAEGRIFVNVAVNTHVLVPVGHAIARNTVSFNVFDPFSGDSVRGDFNVIWAGLVRPMLEWENRFEAKEIKTN